MILVNGQVDNRINIADRGLHYGDGLFETMAYRHGRVELLTEHLNRLAQGCERLAIPYPGDTVLQSDIKQLSASLTADAVIKIIVTRGQGGRGYRTATNSQPTRIISNHALPNYPQSHTLGIRARLCQQTLSENSSLAGIKHLNRLEQVLARQEWDDDAISEGLMFDQHQYLIEGVMSNVFVVRDNVLLTPKLDRSGVAGIMRSKVMECADKLSIECRQTQLSLADLKCADEVFITNSIIIVWPIIQIDNVAEYVHGDITEKTQSALMEMI